MKSLPNKRLLLAVAISLIAHVLFFVVAPRFFPEESPHKKFAALQMWLKEKDQKKAMPSVDQKKPVVLLSPSKKDRRPEKADFFADQDQNAQKNIRARNTGPTRESVDSFSPEEEKNFVKDNQNDLGKPQKQKNSPGPLKPSLRQNQKDPLNIRPHFSLPPKAFSDHLPNVEEGDETKLNAWQWQHAPFFNRIKTRIATTWSPNAQISRHDPQGLLLGHKDRVTVMLVTIDREGSLKDLSVVNQSGVSYLDDEAIRAFREAAPFLYPPKELFMGKDEFSFTFAFHLHLDRGFSFDFNW